MERRYREAESESPLSREQLESLLDFLAERISAEGHDHSTRFTREWLTANNLPCDEALAFLSRHRLKDDYQIAVEGDPFSLFGPTADRLARMPLPEDALESLLDWVDERVQEHGCDHSLRFTRQWLADNSFPIPQTEFALLAQGGGCDCEVVLNVESEGIYP
jgi:hypothetical protein